MNSENDYVQLLKEQFQIEYKKKDRSGIYGLTQRLLTFNSNKIEGSTLTEDQTASLFDTGYISIDETAIRAKDVEEATGHFAMFNYMLDTIEQPLSQELIKQFHFKLKNGVFEDLLNGFPVGEYKNRKNTVDQITTASPNEVEEKVAELLKEYEVMRTHSLEEITLFHILYETIHPFQDGNGRTGRIIAFRECLRSGIIPFIVMDKNKFTYYAALSDYHKTCTVKSLLTFFSQEQEEYYALGLDYVIPYGDKSVEERILEAKRTKAELKIKHGNK